jgi:hypothetical protein
MARSGPAELDRAILIAPARPDMGYGDALFAAFSCIMVAKRGMVAG